MFKRNSFHFELGRILQSHGTLVVEKAADGRRVPRQGAVSGPVCVTTAGVSGSKVL